MSESFDHEYANVLRQARNDLVDFGSWVYDTRGTLETHREQLPVQASDCLPAIYRALAALCELELAVSRCSLPPHPAASLFPRTRRPEVP